MEKILVAYATKYGSTEKIAVKIGEVLRQAELPTDVVQVDRVRELSAYRAVILGSAVYIGKWRKEAVEFLKKNAQALAERPVWLFSSGPTGEGDPVELLKGWVIPGDVQRLVDEIKPRDIAVFHGVLEEGKMSFMEKWIIKNVNAPVGDFRDWEAITNWANSVRDALRG